MPSIREVKNKTIGLKLFVGFLVVGFVLNVIVFSFNNEDIINAIKRLEYKPNDYFEIKRKGRTTAKSKFKTIKEVSNNNNDSHQITSYDLEWIKQISSGNTSRITINESPTCQRMKLSLHPFHSVAATFNNGRLGNQMSSFASLYSVWREFKIYNFIKIQQYKKLSEVFDLPVGHNTSTNIDWPFYIWNDECNKTLGKIKWIKVSEEQLVHNRSLLKEYRFKKHLKFFGYLNDVKGFYPYVDELKKFVFKFKKNHIESAENRLLNMLDSFDINEGNNKGIEKLRKNRTLVSIHVRLGDYEKHLNKVFGLPIVSDAYFTRAMTFISEKYPNVLFYVVSNDVIAAKTKLRVKANEKFKIVFPDNKIKSSVGSDLALIGFADHSILTYGTFGMWGALLGNVNYVIMPKGYSEHRATRNIELAKIKNWIFL